MITVELPLSYLKMLSKISWEWGASRAELILLAIRVLIEKEISSRNSNRNLIPCQTILIDDDRDLNFYKYCISCNNKIHNSKAPYRHENKFKIIELRFCCDCYKKFEKYSIEDFPEFILENIQNKLEKYKERIELD